MDRMCRMLDAFINQLLLWCRMCRIQGAECAECWVFQEKLALLKLKWTECAEYWMISVFDYYFGAECAECRVFHEKLALLKLKWTECAECRVQNVQNVGNYKENLLS